MPSYFSRSDLLNAAPRFIAEQASLEKRATDRSPVGAVFLSHSTKDASLLPGAISILEAHGAIVYVDKTDHSLPTTTSAVTAKLLRDRIKQCKKFVVLVSENSKESRWVPWELGLADGHRSPTNVAIWPSLENQNRKEWTEQEYLGVYRRIVHGKMEGYANDVHMVWDFERNTATELREWLRA